MAASLPPSRYREKVHEYQFVYIRQAKGWKLCIKRKTGGCSTRLSHLFFLFFFLWMLIRKMQIVERGCVKKVSYISQSFIPVFQLVRCIIPELTMGHPLAWEERFSLWRIPFEYETCRIWVTVFSLMTCYEGNLTEKYAIALEIITLRHPWCQHFSPHKRMSKSSFSLACGLQLFRSSCHKCFPVRTCLPFGRMSFFFVGLSCGTRIWRWRQGRDRISLPTPPLFTTTTTSPYTLASFIGT